MPGFPKGKPQQAVRDLTKAFEEVLDRSESRKVKARSKGRCEVVVRGVRCSRRAFEVHHQIGGWKLRGRGLSALAENKTHTCSTCHREITGNVLELEAPGTNRYRRLA